MEKSLILLWTKENLEKAPEKCGVFILRTSPVNGDIVFIRESENLKRDLVSIFDERSFSEVKYFDWYSTKNLEEAREIKKTLEVKYHLENTAD